MKFKTMHGHLVDCYLARISKVGFCDLCCFRSQIDSEHTDSLDWGLDLKTIFMPSLSSHQVRRTPAELAAAYLNL